MARSHPPSSPSSDAIWRREVERRLSRLEAHEIGDEPLPGTWYRPREYAGRRKISVRTVERLVDAGLLEKRCEGRMVFVRDPSGAPPAKRRRGRPPAPKREDIAVPLTGDPSGPQWPFAQTKEPSR
jgi:hypothetical protein